MSCKSIVANAGQEIASAVAGTFFPKKEDSLGLRITNIVTTLFAGGGCFVAPVTLFAGVVNYVPQAIMNGITAAILSGTTDPGELALLANSAADVASAFGLLQTSFLIAGIAIAALGVCVAYRYCMYSSASKV